MDILVSFKYSNIIPKIANSSLNLILRCNPKLAKFMKVTIYVLPDEVVSDSIFVFGILFYGYLSIK
jgi:hypothetical protein